MIKKIYIVLVLVVLFVLASIAYYYFVPQMTGDQRSQDLQNVGSESCEESCIVDGAFERMEGGFVFIKDKTTDRIDSVFVVDDVVFKEMFFNQNSDGSLEFDREEITSRMDLNMGDSISVIKVKVGSELQAAVIRRININE